MTRWRGKEEAVEKEDTGRCLWAERKEEGQMMSYTVLYEWKEDTFLTDSLVSLNQ